jgi:hypothetical protein
VFLSTKPTTKAMKKYALLGLLLGICGSVVAQKSTTGLSAIRPVTIGSTFPARIKAQNAPLTPMDKDISVVTGILSKLIQQEFNNGDTAINLERVQGEYIAGSGVLITIEQHNPFYSEPMLLGLNNQAFSVGRYGLTSTSSGQFPALAEVRGVVELTEKNQAKSPKSKGKTIEKTADATSSPMPLLGNEAVLGSLNLIGDSISLEYINGALSGITTNGSIVMNDNGNSSKKQDSVFASKIPRMKKVLEKFLAEYTILLGKIKPEEKIWVTWSIKEDFWGVYQNKRNCELSARITKQDMLELRTGKITPENFDERIQYSITRCATPRTSNPELEVFSAILERLYSAEVSQNLVQFGAVESEAIGGFGYSFKMNFLSGFLDTLIEVQPNGLTNTYRVQPQNRVNSKQEQAEEFNAFKAEFPRQLLEYSRILKDLQPGEILKVDVSVGENDRLWSSAVGDGVKKLSYSLPQALIRDYDSGKLKLEDAVKLVQIEEQ